jgi:hypothetical protein
VLCHVRHAEAQGGGWGRDSRGSAPDDEEDPRDQRQHREHEALVLKREIEQVDEGVQEEPEAEQTKAETADR